MVNKVNGIKVKKNPLVEIFGRGGKEITFQAINYFLFFLFGLATLYPFIYVVKVSMESIKLVNGLPETVYNFSAYGMVLQNAKIYKSFFLTVGIVAAHTLLHLFFTFISAYPLSKKHFRGRNFFLLFVLFTMLFSGGLIPTYILITQVLNWMDNMLV